MLDIKITKESYVNFASAQETINSLKSNGITRANWAEMILAKYFENSISILSTNESVDRNFVFVNVGDDLGLKNGDTRANIIRVAEERDLYLISPIEFINVCSFITRIDQGRNAWLAAGMEPVVDVVEPLSILAIEKGPYGLWLGARCGSTTRYWSERFWFCFKNK